MPASVAVGTAAASPATGNAAFPALVLRVVTDDEGRRERRWCPMRKGAGDMWRNYQVGIGSNRRYLDALAAAPLKGEGVAALDALCRPRTTRGRTHPRFNPLSPGDLALFGRCSPASTTFTGSATATSPTSSTGDGP